MNTQENIIPGKTIAVVSYLTFIGALIALFMHKDSPTKFGGFHLRQAIGIHLLQLSLAFVIGWFDSLLIFSAFWVFIVVLWAFGFIGAAQGKYQEIPVLGPLFQKWFSIIVPTN